MPPAPSPAVAVALGCVAPTFVWYSGVVGSDHDRGGLDVLTSMYHRPF